MKRLISLLAFLIALTTAYAHNSLSVEKRKYLAESLRAELKEARTARDSVLPMSNLYDVLPRKNSNLLGDSLYYTAKRAGDRSAALNILRNQAKRFFTNDSILNALTRMANEFSDGDDRKETLTFIRFLQNFRNAQYSDRQDRDMAIKYYLEQLNNKNYEDLYDRIALMHGVCMILSEDTNGEIAVAYMDSLANLMKELPASAYSLRNLYNLHAASLFAYSQPQRAMEADRNNIKFFEMLEGAYAKKGRIYRTYHPSYYEMYTRLLSNYKYLSSEDIEKYYAKALDEVDQDPELQEIYTKIPLPDIYYAVAHRQYDKALPMIKKVLNENLDKNTHFQLLEYALDCARKLNDKAAIYEMTVAYTKALKKKLDNLSSSDYRELRIAAAIADMRLNVEAMQLHQHKSKASLQRAIIAVSLCAVVLMAILIIFLFRLYRKNHQLANNLKDSNKQLMAERDKLRQSRADLIKTRDQAQKANNLKSDFIKNMSYEVKVPLQAINEYSHLIADCIAHSGVGSDMQTTSTSAKHLTRFADLIELNSELLSTIIDDVLRLSEIESSRLPIQAQVIDLRTLCDATITCIRRRTQPGVTMTLDPNVPKIELFSDPTRLQQILNNLLSNASKFTSSGSIVLSYNINGDDDEVTFSVTDTGIGINPKNKEKIFGRFVKLDRNTQGAGLGLTIARMLARNLGGDLMLDTTYTGGARFILTIPKK